MNFHLETLNRERARTYRGQSYAVDLVKVGTWGSRATGVLPDDPKAFAIFAIRLTRRVRASWSWRSTDGPIDYGRVWSPKAWPENT